jgi:hypothetical protein
MDVPIYPGADDPPGDAAEGSMAAALDLRSTRDHNPLE